MRLMLLALCFKPGGITIVAHASLLSLADGRQTTKPQTRYAHAVAEPRPRMAYLLGQLLLITLPLFWLGLTCMVVFNTRHRRVALLP